MARSAPFRRKLNKEFRNREFAREYHAERDRLRIAEQIARARQEKGMTQERLARLMGTSQPAVARLERGDYGGYRLATLDKAARALGRVLRVELALMPRSTTALSMRKPAYAVKYAKKPLSRSAAKKR